MKNYNLKRFICVSGLALTMTNVLAQSPIKSDTLTNNIDSTVEWFYENILPNIENVKIVGSHPAANEVRKRWGYMINHLKSQKGSMAEDVKNLLVSPSGLPLDIEILKEIIQVEEEGDKTNITFNIDFFLNEMKEAIENVKEAAEEMAKSAR